ncbi:hypothetical protein ACO0LL_05635 [Undibacterium sp. TC4M20W]|uniref:hypothetical protein n=1 Tax=Undibacterium sp. TC4M20W TaxID=3413052 RepID=UPI003BF12375
MKLSFDNYATLIKVGAVLVVGIYVYRRGLFGVVGDAVNSVVEKGVEIAKPIVYSATKDSALNVVETTGSLQRDLGITEQQATILEALALGNMGA